MRKRVLVVAQDTALRARIARLLQPAGYAVELSASEKRALELSVSEAIDTAIVVTSAGLGGIAFARQMSDRIANLIVLTERPEEVEKIARSLPGADVYPSQSLGEQKLLQRLAELMNSTDGATAAPTEAALRVQDCRIDLAGRTFIHADGREVALTRAEFSLLMALARNPGRVLSRDQLSHAIAGRDAEPYGRGVDMQIRRLRSKIEADPTAPRFILTVSGAGYKFAADNQTIGEGRTSPATDPRQQAERAETLVVTSPNSVSERRQLTVLSCALVGLPASTADIDPEEFAAAGQSFREACTAAIVKNGGRIASSTGHEILALFGYPEAHEDDAERAVHVGLDLTAGIAELAWPSGEPLQMRAGVATGLVVITDQGAIGEPSTVAPHLRDAAPLNSILITAGTRKLIGHAFVCEPPGPYELAGVSGKISACLVTGRLPVESRFSSKRGPRLTQFIGREQELRQLSTLWERVKAGHGQVALLCGEAGIGKSRACEVFLERIAAEPHVRMRYQCAPHHANSPFYPIIEQLERVANFKPGDAPGNKLDKLAATLSVTGAVTPADIRTCAALMSIPTGETPAPAAAPQRQKEITIDVLLRVILALSQKESTVLELADAHWADSSTLELFGRLIASIRTASVFVLISFRPEFVPPWLDQPHVTMLRLDRLERGQTEALVFDIAGPNALPAEMTAQIIAKTDGVPLFVEELTKSVLESGVLQGAGDRLVAAAPLPSLAIPTTLLGSLTARLDRLGAAREIAQIGAAIGREFSYRLLAAVAPISGQSLQAALARLIAHDLIFVRGGRPSDAVYVFKHALVQDAAYSTLLRSKRQQLHGQIADALERDFPEIIETQPELLAHHLIQAGLTERAIDYLRKAGRRAIDRSANREAIGHLTQALKLLSSLPGGPTRRQQALGLEVTLGQAMIAVHGYAARETADVLLRAKDLIDDSTDPAQKLAILYGVWACHYVGGEVAEQTDAAADFLKEAERHQDNTALCVAHRIVGTTHLTKGEFATALPHLQHARSLYDPRRPMQFQYGQDAGAAALCYLSWTLWHQGYIDQASQVAAQAMKRADELSHPHTRVFTICHARGMMDIFQRRSGDMISYARSVIALCREHGFSHWLACGRILEGWATVNQGETDRGIEIISGGVAAWRGAGAGLWLPLFLMLLAEAFSMAGSNETALTVIDQAIAIAEQTGERWCVAEILRIKAGLLLATDPASEQVEILLASSLHVARSQNARCWELRAACDLAALWQRKNRTKDALLLLQPVYAQFTEGFDSADLQKARRILDGLETPPSEKQEKSNKRKARG
jgi:DNA-binding response OmpR family regulator/predicted ATPase